jgi:8-oxo-dGTP diphosphatase
VKNADKDTHVVGFLFRNRNNHVALIRKTKPAWQAGKLNGIGGKIEAGETPLQAMRREFKEETGADVEDWRHFCTLIFRDARIQFFVAHEGEHPIALKSTTEEPVAWYGTGQRQVYDEGIPNLRWLIPMAIDKSELIAAVQDPS